MRLGEIIALTISDINLKDMTITVNKRIKKGVIDSPKTESSIRKVPIINNLKPFLKESIENAQRKKTFNLFTNIKGNIIYSSDKLHNKLNDLLKKCGIKQRAMYNTRHTFATLAIKKGIPVYQVSQILGHKNLNETLTTYAKFTNNEH